MEFLNPHFLWALPVVAIPGIIYYLMRFRSLRVDWGATYVLEQAIARLRKQFYWDQLLLIILRTLACLLILLAFVRPSSGVSAVAGADTIHRIMVFDQSYSMLAEDGDGTRWDRAKEIAINVSSEWSRGQLWSLLLLGEETKWPVDGEAFSTAEAAAARITPLKTEETAVTVSRAFELIQEKFPDGNIEIYLFSDDQATTWLGSGDISLPAGTSIYWINPTLTGYRNVAVTKVGVASERILAGHPNTVTIGLRNFSTEPMGDLSVELLVDGSFHGRASTALQPGQSTELPMEVTLESPGSHHLSARISGDALPYDNQGYAGIEVVESWNVLMLAGPDGDPGVAWQIASLLGRLPNATDEVGDRVFNSAVPLFTLYDKPEPPDLNGIDLVMLDGSRGLTPEGVDVLRGYVLDGGALLLMAGPDVDMAAWNDLLGGAGLLPAPLTRLHRNKLGGSVFQTLTPAESAKGALAGFATKEDGDITHSRFYQWVEFGAPSEQARVVSRFGDGNAFLVEKHFGPGGVLLMSGSFNGAYNNLIVREFFLPFVFRVTAQALISSHFPLTVGTNAPIRLQLDNPGSVRAVTFDLNGGELLTMASPGNTLEFTTGAPRSGICRALILRGGTPESVWIGVQGPRVDSDLTPIPAGEIERLSLKHGMMMVGDWSTLQAELHRNRSGNEWHHLLLIGLLCCLIGEMRLQWRFV